MGAIRKGFAGFCTVWAILGGPSAFACNLDQSIRYPDYSKIDQAATTAKAQAGDPEAQYVLGNAVQAGEWGLKPDFRKGCDWYRKAAYQGYAKAQYDYAFCGATFLGRYQEGAHQFKWTKLSADNGYSLAQCSLGELYRRDDLPYYDEEKAVAYSRLAAAQGMAEAQGDLGDHFYEGKGVAIDKTEAARWFRLASDQGDGWAAFKLANMYVIGDGVIANRMEAAKQFMLARSVWASRVSPDKIADEYLREDGSIRDPIAYYGWLSHVEEFEATYNPPPYRTDMGPSLTLEGIISSAETALAHVRRTFSPSELAEAERFSADLRPLLLAHNKVIQFQSIQICDPKAGCKL